MTAYFLTWLQTFVFATLLLLSGTSKFYAQSAVQDSLQNKSSTSKTSTAEQVVLETPTGTLYGTLELPKSNPPFPIVLIIAGSGPTDRDGNSKIPPAPFVRPGPNNSHKMIAEGLAAQGIASLRYDKRGIGESAKAMVKEADVRFDTLIHDAVLWGRKLRGDNRFSSLTIAGHSEGSLIGMVATQKVGADAFVSIAGTGLPAKEILLEQLRKQLLPDLLEQTEEILNTLSEGKTYHDSIPPVLSSLFRPSVQPYLLSWFRYDPAKEIAKLSIPLLIVQGTTDIQTSVEDAKLLSKANSSAKLLLIEGMNHMLKEIPKELDKQLKSYVDPTIPVSPKLISEISGFVNGVKRQKF